jgi:quercetin dioxygenase-like cupin family protein
MKHPRTQTLAPRGVHEVECDETGKARERTLAEEDRARTDLANLGLKLALITMVLVLGVVALAQTAAPSVVVLTPAEMKWQSQGAYAAAGMEQLNLVGDPTKPGPYTLRLKFPTGFRVAPHTHPDSHEVTILSGTFATGYGEEFDDAKLKILPAGSFYTEPANVPHYIEIEEEVVLQVSGTGPSGRRFVDRPEGSK